MRSAAGEVVVPVEITDAMRPGVVSLPHGWGHDRPGTRMSVAARERGREQQRARAAAICFDPLSGNAVLNGIPVELEPA